MKSKTMARVFALAALAGALGACGGGEPEPQSADDVVQAEPIAEPTQDPSALPPEPAPPPPPPITVTAGENSPVEGTAPTVRIQAPTKNQVVPAGAVKVRLQVRNWQTAADGPHVHLIVDDEPYRRIDDPSQPIELPDLTEGEHVLRVFPSRATHESVKTPGAFAMVRFFVGARPADAQNPPRGPMPTLTYSRPKGAYNGDAMNHLLLDFYLTDVTLAPDGARVHYWIDGANEGDITAWVPHYIDNLPEGTHRITLELRDAQNQPIAGRFNRSEREITLSRAPAAPAPDPHANH